MALSKSKIKNVTKTNLYYNLYKYRLNIRGNNLYYIGCHKTLADFTTKMTMLSSQYEKYNLSNKTWQFIRNHRYFDQEKTDSKLAEFIFSLRYSDQARLRFEGNTVSIFTNDLKILDKLNTIVSYVKVEEAEVSPHGVMYFAKDPPASYRVYMKDYRVNSSFQQDINDFLARTPDLRPSNSLQRFLRRPTISFIFKQYYIDYDDEKNLMMLTILFPEVIGKKYKLEKKPT